MSRTVRQQVQPKDWWTRRPLSGVGVSRRGMKSWKRLCNSMERMAIKAEIRKERAS